MTVPRLTEMTEYWKENPPLHVMVAAYFGISKDKGGNHRPSELDENGNSLFDLLPQG